MTTTRVDSQQLTAWARHARGRLRRIDRDRATTEDAVAALRRGTDPGRVRLDAGLLAEVDAAVDAWRAVDRLVLAVADAVRRSDLAGAVTLQLSTARAHAATSRDTSAEHLLGELRHAATGPPTVVASWFAQLDVRERDLLARHGGRRIGSLDGIPLAVRDGVNRRLVEGELQRLRAEVDSDGWWERNVDVPGLADGLHDAHVADLARIRSLEALLDADLVLLFDPAGDGRAVAAHGDPATADHVATVVPGISNHLGNLRGTLDDARHLQRVAADSRSGTVATIAWLGYDTPGGIGNHTHELVTEATHGDRARDGARDLTRFLHGLQQVRTDGPAHVSVIGHSYGSRVLGEVLSRGEVVLDQAVAVGSPGMGVDHVGEWDLPARTTVWAESTGTPDGSWWLPGGGDDPVAHVPLHGRNPDDPSFGARGFDVTGSAGHSAYFAHQPGTGKPSRSLRNIAAIVTGQQPTPDADHVEVAPGPSGRVGPVLALP